MSAASIGKEMTPAGGLLAIHRPTNVAWLRAGGVLLTGYGTGRLNEIGLTSGFNARLGFYFVLTLGGLAASLAWAHAELFDDDRDPEDGETRRNAPFAGVTPFSPRRWVEWVAVALALFGAHSLVKLVGSRVTRRDILAFAGDVALSNAVVAAAVMAVCPAGSGGDLVEDVFDLLADVLVGPTGAWTAQVVAEALCLAATWAVVGHFVLETCWTGAHAGGCYPRSVICPARIFFGNMAEPLFVDPCCQGVGREDSVRVRPAAPITSEGGAQWEGEHYGLSGSSSARGSPADCRRTARRSPSI